MARGLYEVDWMTPYYSDDWVTIYHGDCREIMPSLTPVDVAFADPPYGVGFDYLSGEDSDNCAWVHNALTTLAPLVFVTPGIRNVHAWPAPTWMLAWAKPGSTRRSDLGGFNEWEPILMYGKRRLYHDLRSLPSVANLARGTTETHPCPKPLKLLTWLVEESTDAGQTILDPFMGSGTTLKAAKECGRKAIGIELEEAYCEIATRRLAQEVLA